MNTPNTNAPARAAAEADLQHEGEAANDDIASDNESTDAGLDSDQAPSELINDQVNAGNERLQRQSPVGRTLVHATLQAPPVAPPQAVSASGICQFIPTQRDASAYQGPAQPPSQAVQTNQAHQYAGAESGQSSYQMPFQALPHAQIYPTYQHNVTNSSGQVSAGILGGIPGQMGIEETDRGLPQQQLQGRQPHPFHGNMAGLPPYQMVYHPPPRVQPAMNYGQVALQMGQMNEMAETDNAALGNVQNENMLPVIGHRVADNMGVIQRLEELNEEIAECEEQLIILNRLRTLMRRRGG